MNTIASLFGSGTGLIVIGLAVVILNHYHHAPSATHPWVMRLVILMMFAGGSVLAVTALGQWVTHFGASLMAMLGGTGHAFAVLAATFLVFAVVVGAVFAPVEAVAYTAAFLPLVLALIPGGMLHQFYVSTTVPAQAWAAQISAWLAG